MIAQFLPQDHIIETVHPGSRFIGARDYSTGRTIIAGDAIVVCRRVAQPAVTCVEAWSEAIESCYNCGLPNPGFGVPPPHPYSTTVKAPPVGVGPAIAFSSIPTVVVRPDPLPDAGPRRPQGNRLTPLFALIIAVALMLTLGGILIALTTGPEADLTVTGQPAQVDSEQVVLIPTEEPTRRIATPQAPTLAPTPIPPPTERIRPTAIPKPTAILQPASPIRELVLIDAASDRSLFALTDGSTISLSNIGARDLDIQANVGGSPVGSIKFQFDGRDFCLNDRCIENSPPYSMAGDLGGDHYANWDWSNLLGTHTITAIPYTGPGATGEALPALTVEISVTR